MPAKKLSNRKAKAKQVSPNQSAKSHLSPFSRFAHLFSRVAGSSYAFIVAIAVVLVWAVVGPVFDYSDTWQLVINTGTTIVTFLMVFLIQNTQNRDVMALQLKLSELIIAVRGAHNQLATLEDLSDERLEELHQEFCEHADILKGSLEQRRQRKPKV
jgi:low affinity Fe/Cu permease